MDFIFQNINIFLGFAFGEAIIIIIALLVALISSKTISNLENLYYYNLTFFASKNILDFLPYNTRVLIPELPIAKKHKGQIAKRLILYYIKI